MKKENAGQGGTKIFIKRRLRKEAGTTPASIFQFGQQKTHFFCLRREETTMKIAKAKSTRQMGLVRGI